MASSYWSPERGSAPEPGTTTPASEPAFDDEGEATVFDPEARVDDSLIGRTLRGRFVLEEEIGHGGMGVVYRARDLRREEAQDRRSHIAIKVLSGVAKRRADAMVALQREAKRAQLLAHPNIATVYDFDREGDVAYLCMELLSGHTLHDVLKRSDQRGLPLGEALPIVEGMARGLAYAHDRGIVHADFKPGNVFVTDDGFVKVLDFGIARVLPKLDQTSNTRFDGGRLRALTPAYASCEMFQGREPDPRDDVYGLACVTYELLTGNHPFHRLPAPEARDQALEVKRIRGLSRRQNRALRHALAFERERRCASAEAFLVAFMPKPSGLRLTLVLLAAGLLSMAAATAITTWLLTRAPALEPIAATPVEATAADEAERPGTGPPSEDTQDNDVPAEPVPVDTATRERIGRILEMADLHLAVGRLTDPPGSNAAEAYAAVNELQPGNPLARAGLADVADRLEAQAREALRQGRRGDAAAIVADALKWTPRHDGLRTLQAQLAE